MTYRDYCQKAGVPYTPARKIVPTQDDANRPTGEALLTYMVPELTPDGTCSVGSALTTEPYDLKAILRATKPQAERDLVQQLRLLHDYLATIQSSLQADWIGVYQVATNVANEPVLVKLAYQGNPSRAEFPLTEDFARRSNNSKVGLTGKAVIINNVATHDGPYYTCDDSVQSEICLPIYDIRGKSVIGIVDAESFQQNYFDADKLASVAQLCHALPRYLPIGFR